MLKLYTICAGVAVVFVDQLCKPVKITPLELVVIIVGFYAIGTTNI